MSYFVGFSRAIITPSLDRPVYLAGFGQNRRATDVHDDLFVRALAVSLDNSFGVDAELVILVALDLIGLARMHVLEIERRVREAIPHAHVLVACTHTHHGPDTIGLWGPDYSTTGLDPEYISWLKDRIVETCLMAASQFKSANLRAASVRVPGVAKNARDPHIVDDELTCLQFVDAEGEYPTVTLLIFPCHPEVLWEGNPHITSDYPGYLRQRVEAVSGGDCIFFAGALGGMMTPDVRDHSFEEAEQMGDVLAQRALHSLAQEQVSPEEGRLSFQRVEFSIPMTNPIFRMAIDAGLLPDFLQPDGSLLTEASLTKIGPAWLVGVPGELLPRLGLEIKRKLVEVGVEFPAVVGLANDELGYILHEEDFIYPENPFEPGDHYEETMSVGPEAGPSLMAVIWGML